MGLTLFINPEHPAGDALDVRVAEHERQVSIARAAGCDGVTIGTHLSYGSAALAASPSDAGPPGRVRRGMSLSTCMLVLPHHHPVQVAIDGAFLDVVCGGRFVLGASAGWTPPNSRYWESTVANASDASPKPSD